MALREFRYLFLYSTWNSVQQMPAARKFASPKNEGRERDTQQLDDPKISSI